MEEKLQHFFNCARVRLDDAAPARERPSKPAKIPSLKEIAKEEFGGILDALEDQDDFITFTEEKPAATPTLRITISSTEELPEKLKSQPPGARGREPMADIVIVLEMPQPGHVAIQLKNLAVLEDTHGPGGIGVTRSFRVDEPASFEETRQLLAEALAEMAPVTMGKICGEPASQQRGISIMRAVRLKGL